MKLHKLLILTAILFSVHLVIAGEYVDLYKNFIPDSLLKNPAYRADIERNLKTYLELDPSLVYYSIETLKMAADSMPQAPRKLWAHLLQKHFGKSKLLKQKWASAEKSQIEQKYEPKIKVNEISDYYDNFVYRLLKKTNTIKPDPTDENKKNFFVYLYFSKSAHAKYDPGKKYSEMLKPLVQQMIDRFNAKFEHKEHLTKEQLREFINTAFQYSYLFKDGYLDIFPNHTNFHIYELIAYYLEDDYINHNAVTAQITYNFIPIIHNETFSFTDPFNIKYDYKYNIETWNTIYINAGFRFKIKELLYPFSYINMSVGFAIQKPLNNTFKKQVFFKGTRAMSGLSYQGSYYISDYRDMKYMFLTAQISTPVYYVSKKIFFEAGINYTLHKISFTYDFNRSGVVQDPYGSADVGFFVDEVKTYDENKNLIYPVVSLNYLALKSINLRLEYIMPVQAQLVLGYYLNF